MNNPILSHSNQINKQTTANVDAMADFLRANADRLIVRAQRQRDTRERDRLLKMAAAAIETASDLAQGGQG